MWTIVIGMVTGYKFDKHLAGWIGKSQWLTKCKGLDGERGVRDSTQLSALGKELLFSETGNTESWGWGMVQVGPGWVWCDCGVSRWRCLTDSQMWGRESKGATWNILSLIPAVILRMSGFTQGGYWWEGELMCSTWTPPHLPNNLVQLRLQKRIKFLCAVPGLITLILPEPDLCSSSISKSRPLGLHWEDPLAAG